MRYGISSGVCVCVPHSLVAREGVNVVQRREGEKNNLSQGNIPKERPIPSVHEGEKRDLESI